MAAFVPARIKLAIVFVRYKATVFNAFGYAIAVRCLPYRFFEYEYANHSILESSSAEEAGIVLSCFFRSVTRLRDFYGIYSFWVNRKVTVKMRSETLCQNIRKVPVCCIFIYLHRTSENRYIMCLMNFSKTQRTCKVLAIKTNWNLWRRYLSPS